MKSAIVTLTALSVVHAGIGDDIKGAANEAKKAAVIKLCEATAFKAQRECASSKSKCEKNAATQAGCAGFEAVFKTCTENVTSAKEKCIAAAGAVHLQAATAALLTVTAAALF